MEWDWIGIMSFRSEPQNKDGCMAPYLHCLVAPKPTPTVTFATFLFLSLVDKNIAKDNSFFIFNFWLNIAQCDSIVHFYHFMSICS